jgi:glycosyltransferase involved in cell wall biosynthesis
LQLPRGKSEFLSSAQGGASLVYSMKILFDFKTDGWGGNEIMACRIARIFCDQGCRVFVRSKDGSQFQNVLCIAPDVHSFDEKELVHYTILILPSMLNILSPQNLRTIFRHRTWIYAPFWGYEWNSGWRRWLKRLVAKGFFAYFSRTIAISYSFYSRLGVKNGPVFPNVAELNTTERPSSGSIGAKNAPLKLISAGRYDFRQKGQDRLIYLVRDLKAIDLEVHFFGSGPDEMALKQLANTVGNISVFGWGCWYDNADDGVLVLSSYFEGLPLVALEAIQHRIPIVATRDSGLEDLLDTEAFFDLHDAATLQSSLEFVLSEWKRVVNRNKERMEATHSINALNYRIQQFWDGRVPLPESF